jgi:hypothetical protein
MCRHWLKSASFSGWSAISAKERTKNTVPVLGSLAWHIKRFHQIDAAGRVYAVALGNERFNIETRIRRQATSKRSSHRSPGSAVQPRHPGKLIRHEFILYR